MPKNKIWLHLTIFLILLLGTTYFTYEAFAPNKISENKNQITENSISQIIEPAELIENNVATKKEATKNSPKNTESEINLEINNKEEDTFTTSTGEKIVENLPYSATITVDGKNYIIGFEKEGSVLKDLLDKLQTESDFRFSGTNYSGIGFFITEINGIKNDNKKGKYWVYYLNGQSAQAGVSVQKINSNDNIEWKYEESTF